MDSVNTSDCLICYSDYDWEDHKPCIGTCGHSICEACKKQMTAAKCPQCNKDHAFYNKTINYQVLEFMKKMQKLQESLGISTTDGEKLMKKYSKGTCSECGICSSKLRYCAECENIDGIAVDSNGTVTLTTNDRTVQQAMLLVREVALCGDCVLDGNHKGHQTVTLLQLHKSFNQLLFKKVQEKLGQYEVTMKHELDCLTEQVSRASNKLMEYANEGTNLPGKEKRQHYDNVSAMLEELEITEAALAIVTKKLMKTENEIDKQHRYVRNTNRVYDKALAEQSLNGSMLTIDRKWNQDPVALGLFEPSNNAWKLIRMINTTRKHFAVATLSSKLYIIGGESDKKWLTTVEECDQATDLRRNCHQMKGKRGRTAAGFHNGKLYVCGGHNGAYMSSTEIYDIQTDTWVDGPNLKKRRADAAVVSCSGKLYVIGGFDGSEYVLQIEELNETTNCFELVADMREKRVGFGCCTFMERIYVAGGWSNKQNTLRTCQSFDPISKKWKDEPSMVKARKGFTLQCTDKAIYAIRGNGQNMELISEIEVLNPGTLKWDVIQCEQPSTSGSSSS